MTLSTAVLAILAVIVVVRIVAHWWPRLALWSRTAQIVRALESERAARHRDMDRIAAYHELLTSAGAGELAERAWQDLDLDEVFHTLDRAESEPGRQYLYRLLRTPTDSREQLVALDRAATRLAADHATAGTVRDALRRLRDPRAAGLTHLFFLDALPDRPRGWWLFPLLTAASVTCLLLVRAWPPSFVVWAGLCVVNVAVQVFYRPRVERYIPAIHELPAFLRASAALGAQADIPELAAPCRGLGAGTNRFARLRWASAWLMLEPEQTNELAASLYQYVNMLFLFDVNAFMFATRTIRKEQAELRRMFEAIGWIDAALSVARWRSSLDRWARPELGEARKAIDVEDVVHPLVEAAVPNSLTVEQSVLITGSNMSGKSTFIRALGVNAVLAQTLYTVCAARWRAPWLRVRTSIGRSDSVVEGKSYYLAELETVGSLVRSKRASRQHLYLLDEIFRGTNTTERVAAAAAVLSYLDRGQDLVVVATHDIEVLDLLGDAYAARHFREQVSEGGEGTAGEGRAGGSSEEGEGAGAGAAGAGGYAGRGGGRLTFDYRIQEGRSSTRNAIALLRVTGFPEEVVEDALGKLDWADGRVVRES